MTAQKLPGGPTQDEVLAITLQKLRIRSGDLVLDCGCGTGNAAIAMAQPAGKVVAIDRRSEAVRFAKQQAKTQSVTNIEFFNLDARDFLHKDSRMFDCAFIGGTRGIDNFLQPLSCRVRRTIVVNAVLVSTLWTVISKMQELGIFSEVVQVQVSRSHELAGSLMFRPLDPVFIIVGKCEAC